MKNPHLTRPVPRSRPILPSNRSVTYWPITIADMTNSHQREPERPAHPASTMPAAHPIVANVR